MASFWSRWRVAFDWAGTSCWSAWVSWAGPGRPSGRRCCTPGWRPRPGAVLGLLGLVRPEGGGGIDVGLVDGHCLAVRGGGVGFRGLDGGQGLVVDGHCLLGLSPMLR